MQPVAAVFNPAAAGGRSKRVYLAFLAHARRADIQVHVFTTSAPGDGVEQTRRAIALGFTTIVAGGGDGTLHEVINGIASSEALPGRVRVGVLPAGTGMDFTRNAHLKLGVDASIERIVRNRIHAFDVGVVTEPFHRYFLNFAEVGLGASVVTREAAFSRRWPGRVSFLLAGIAAAARDEPANGTVRVDGQIVYEGRLVSLVVANGQYFGGGMKIAPPANMHDGLLDVVVIGDISRFGLVTQVWKLYPGTHLHNPDVMWVQGNAVTFHPHGDHPLDLDGELYRGGNSAISVIREGLHILV